MPFASASGGKARRRIRAARRIVEQAKRRGLVCGVAESLHFYPVIRQLKWAIREGHLGTVQFFHFFGIGGHWAPDKILGETAWRHRKVLAAKGAVGSLIFSWAGRGGISNFPGIFIGTTGYTDGQMMHSDGRPATTLRPFFLDQTTRQAREQLFPDSIEHAFALELLDFFTAIKSGKPLEVSGEEGMRDLAISFAALESSLQGRRVSPEDILRGRTAVYEKQINKYHRLERSTVVSEEFKLGIIGLVHDHIWMYEQMYHEGLQDAPGAEIVCAADESPPLLEKLRGILGLPQQRLYADYRKMLAEVQLDGCLIFAANCRHAQLLEACASRGLHVLVEKPMASSLADADRMLAASREHGIRLMVNFPLFFMPLARGCHQAVQSGLIGRVWQMRFQTGHSGPENFRSRYFTDWLMNKEGNGGGALMDFCVYGAALLTWFFGRPDEVTAVAGNFVKRELGVEDHTAVTVRYRSPPVLGCLEGTWCSMPTRSAA